MSVERTSSIEAAALALLSQTPPGESVVAVVEGGYFDPRETIDALRERQLFDSFALADRLADDSRIRATILHVAFINDIGTTAPLCEETTKDERGDASCYSIPPWAIEAYRRRLGESGAQDLPKFYAKAARNRLARCVGKELRRRGRANELDGDALHERRIGPDLYGIYVETNRSDEFLGYRKEGIEAIAVRCAGLMAQHYRDLYEFALAHCPDATSVWIFDFLRDDESQRVRAGADIAHSLYRWEDVPQLKIVNCVYPVIDAANLRAGDALPGILPSGTPAKAG